MYCQFCGAQVEGGTVFCTRCGRPIAGSTVTNPSLAASAAPGFPTSAATAIPAVTIAGSHGGFWLRLVAAFIDNLVLLVPMAPIAFLLFAGSMPVILRGGYPSRELFRAGLLPHMAAFFAVAILVRWLYWALMESSEGQATLGKRAMGLYVSDLSGQRTTFAKASGRFFAGRGIGSIPLLGLGSLYYLIDCICAGVTEKKQAIHDMIAGCYVMKRR